LKKTLSASAYLASQAQEPIKPVSGSTAASRRKKADVVFPLAHSPDDPGLDDNRQD